MNYASKENTTVANRPTLTLAIGQFPPTAVELVSPADGSVLPRESIVNLSATVSPGDSTISTVAFYDGATKIGNGTLNGSTWSLNSLLTSGSHLLSIIATDSNGLSRTSLTSRVDVAFKPTITAGSLSMTRDSSLDVDLTSLTSDPDTALSKIKFATNSASSGTVTLLADGKTARFTPAKGAYGPVSFSITATDQNATLLAANFDFSSSNLSDASGHDQSAFLRIRGSGTASFSTSTPTPLNGSGARSIVLQENGTAGAARLEYTSSNVDFRNDDWTIAGWFKRNGNSNMDAVLQLGESGGFGNDAMSLAFYGSSSTLELLNYSGSVKDVSLAAPNLAISTWHHFAVVRNGGTLSLYVNGALAGNDNAFSFTFDGSKPLKIGGLANITANVTDRWFNGSFADLAIYKFALSAPEIVTLTKGSALYAGAQVSTASIPVTILTSLENWRLKRFGSIANSGPGADTADPDMDGVPNLEEFTLGTDPKSANQRVTLSITASSLETKLSFFAAQTSGADYAGLVRYYDVETTTNLADPNSWTPLTGQTNIVGANQTVNITLPAATAPRFYRLKVRIQ